MDRRRSGVLSLLIAAVLVIVVPQALDPGQSGSAARAPLPAPPMVGSCLSGPDHDVVSCAELHNSEVTAAWIAGDPAGPISADDAPCWQPADEYIGDSATKAVSGWDRYPAMIDVRLVQAPQSEGAGRWGWKACVVLPAVGGQYTGSAAGVGKIGHRMGAFASCAGAVPLRIRSAVPDVNCLQAHGGEFLGSATGFEPNVALPDDAATFVPVPSDEEFRAGCRSLAAELMDADDPTYGGALALSTLIESAIATGSSNGAREVGGKILSELTYSGTATTALCIVRSADSRVLVDSVIGLGEGEPPLQ